MNLLKIESEAFHLSREEHSQLIQSLVLSLDSPSEGELEYDWLIVTMRTHLSTIYPNFNERD